MGQNLEVRSGSITHRSTASLRIPVDDSLSYFIYILDPKIHFPTYDPSMINGIVIQRNAKPVSNMIAIKVGTRYIHTTRNAKIILCCM